MSISTKSKNAKLITIALVMAVVAGGLAIASSHNAKQAAKNNPAKNSSTGTHTVTTKDGKKVVVPNAPKSSEQKAKVAEERLQKRIDSAVKQKRITDAQAKLIKTKAAEVAKASTATQDPKARAEKQKELYSWARENKIPVSFVFEMSRPRG